MTEGVSPGLQVHVDHSSSIHKPLPLCPHPLNHSSGLFKEILRLLTPSCKGLGSQALLPSASQLTHPSLLTLLKQPSVEPRAHRSSCLQISLQPPGLSLCPMPHQAKPSPGRKCMALVALAEPHHLSSFLIVHGGLFRTIVGSISLCDFSLWGLRPMF